jgi:hypothetical protein
VNRLARKISENLFVKGILMVPAKAMYRLGKKNVKKFFRDPKSWGFAGRVGMALACAGLLAAGIGFAPFGPVITKALLWIAMQIPINIIKDSALATAKKEWKHLKNNTHKIKVPRIRTLAALAGIAGAAGVGIYLVGPGAVGAAVLRGSIIAATFSIKTSRGIFKKNIVKDIKEEGRALSGDNHLPTVSHQVILHSLHQMPAPERKKIFDAIHKKFGAEFAAAAGISEDIRPQPAAEQQNAPAPASAPAKQQARFRA